MRSEAYRLTGFTVVISAFGFLLRWLQNIRIIDPDTGLAARGMGISFLLAAVIAAAGIAFAVIAVMLKKCAAPEEPERALGGEGFLFRAVNVVPVLLLVLAGIVELFQANASNWPELQIGIRRISAAATLAGAAGAGMIARYIGYPEKRSLLRIGAGLMILFGGIWLIAIYKSAASDPVVWRSAVEILAVCGALLAVYYVAGYFFEEPSPRTTVFICHFAAFLCIMSAVDEHTLGENLCYAAVAVQLLLWGWTLTANMRREGEELPTEEA